jgi:hypothetical protein
VWYLVPSHVVAKGVQLRLPAAVQREVLVFSDDSPKAKRRRRTCSSTASTMRYQVGMPRQRGVMRETSSTAQPRHGHAWADGDFDADLVIDRGFAWRRRRQRGATWPLQLRGAIAAGRWRLCEFSRYL